MTLIGGQDTGLGNVDTGGQPDGEGGGDIIEVTSSDGSVEITNPTGPVVDLKVPSAIPLASDVPGLSFPVVAGVSTLTANDPVTLPGLEVTGDAELLNGYLLQGPPGSRTIDSPDITGAATVDGSLDVSGGATTFHAGAPVTCQDSFEAENGFLLQGPPGSRTIDSPDISGSATLNTSPLSPTQIFTVANLAALAALVATNIPIASFAWVSTLGAYFELQTSALATTPTTVIAASGAAGAQWLRMNWINPAFEAVTTWAINTATGSDEAAGTGGAPLLTLSELANRLAFCRFSHNVTVTMSGGDMATTDRASFTFSLGAGGSFTINSTPTVLYTGSVTTAVNVSAAPTTTENNLTDTAVPVSFTAAGLMAPGVLFRRTSGTVATFWALLDKGAQTARITQPTSGGFASVTFANGDVYTASQLPKMTQPRFTCTSLSANTGNGITINGFYFSTAPTFYEPMYQFSNCWFTNGRFTAGQLFLNCLFQTGGTTQFGGGASNAGGGPATFFGGGILGTGLTALSLIACPCGVQIAANNKFTLQSAAIDVLQGSFFFQQADLLCYDATGYPILVDYNSTFMQAHAGAFGGSNNAELANVGHASSLIFTTNPYFVAGSSTDAVTPLLANGTAATNVAGIATLVRNTQGNGIFLTS